MAEAMAAMLIIGLSMGAMVKGSEAVLKTEQRTASHTAASITSAAITWELKDVLTGSGPFGSDGEGRLVGDANGFSYPCEGGACSAIIASRNGHATIVFQTPTGTTRANLPDQMIQPKGQVQWTYVTATGQLDHWPVIRQVNGRDVVEPLLQVELSERRSGRLIASGRIWREQAADCAFDGIARDCRKIGP